MNDKEQIEFLKEQVAFQREIIEDYKYVIKEYKSFIELKDITKLETKKENEVFLRNNRIYADGMKASALWADFKHQ